MPLETLAVQVERCRPASFNSFASVATSRPRTSKIRSDTFAALGNSYVMVVVGLNGFGKFCRSVMAEGKTLLPFPSESVIEFVPRCMYLDFRISSLYFPATYWLFCILASPQLGYAPAGQ